MRAIVLACGVIGAPVCPVVHAQNSSNAATEAAAPSTALSGNLDPSISTSIPPLAVPKQALLERGVNFELSYIQDTFGNVTGGVQQAATYNSAIYMLVEGDLGKLANLPGATFRVNAFQIQGVSLSTSNVYNYSTISSIAALPSTRLVELWVEQKLFADMASIRIGQLSADAEFFASEFDAPFVNGTFGWANLFAANLPGSGPGYPLATPGVRLKVTPNDHVTLLAAIFNGDPAGTGFSGKEQIADPSGVNFRLSDPALLFGEAQYSYNQGKASYGLAGTIKLGGWYHAGSFNDNHFGYDGKSLADPLGVGVPLSHGGDFAVYGVFDQMLWRLPGDDPKKGAAVFARMAASPSDRNLITFYGDAGVNFTGVLPQRPDDSFGCAAAFSRLSPSVTAYDKDAAFFSGALVAARNYELALELTYKAIILPGWTLQPDFQYIIHPGGGVADPDNRAVRIPDAAVIGLRTIVTF